MASEIKTGKSNFEKLVEGTIHKGSTVLVQGKYGTGKTTFGLQYIVKGITDQGELGAFISLSDDREELLMDSKRFGWPVKRFEKIGTLNILDSSSLEKKSGDKIKRIVESVEEKEIDRLVIDDVNKLKELYGGESSFKIKIHELKRKLREFECTTLLTGDLDIGIEEIVDGVIILHYGGDGIEKTRTIEIRKMRRTEHTHRLRPFEITSKGIKITGPLE